LHFTKDRIREYWHDPAILPLFLRYDRNLARFFFRVFPLWSSCPESLLAASSSLVINLLLNIYPLACICEIFGDIFRISIRAACPTADARRECLNYFSRDAILPHCRKLSLSLRFGCRNQRLAGFRFLALAPFRTRSRFVYSHRENVVLSR